jgi:hypothetical protein
VIRERFVIGADDTDAPGSAGTGELLCGLAERAASDGFGSAEGVTRHQLWASEKVRATADNACYALALETDRDVLDVEDYVADFVRSEAASGANAAIAILSRHSDMPHALAFGRRAQQELLRERDAEQYAAESNVLLRSLAGSRAGIVGALAAAGLRGGGKDGRYTWLPGLAALTGRLRAGQVREASAIQQILDPEGEEVDRDDLIDFGEGIRPPVEDGRPILRVVPSPAERRLWVPAADR